MISDQFWSHDVILKVDKIISAADRRSYVDYARVSIRDRNEDGRIAVPFFEFEAPAMFVRNFMGLAPSPDGDGSLNEGDLFEFNVSEARQVSG